MRDPDLLHPVVGDDVLVRGAGGLEGVQRVHRPHVLPQRLKVTLDRGGNLYKKNAPLRAPKSNYYPFWETNRSTTMDSRGQTKVTLTNKAVCGCRPAADMAENRFESSKNSL